MDNGAIIRATKAVIEGALGSVRTMPSGALAAQAYDSMGDDTLQRRVRVQARYETDFGLPSRTKVTGHQSGAMSIYSLDMILRLYFTTEIELNESERTATKARAADLSVRVQEALCFAGNLLTDGTYPTNIVSGCYMLNGTPRVTRQEWGKRIYSAEIPFRCYVKEYSPLAAFSPLQLPRLAIWVSEAGLQTSGADVTGWTNAAAPIMPSFARYDNTVVPALPTLGTIGALPCIEMGGATNQRLLSYSAITNAIQETRWYAAVAVEIDDVSTNQANHWDNVAIFSDTGRNWGIILRKVAGQIKASGYSYGTTAHIAEIDIDPGFHVLEFGGDGTSLWIRDGNNDPVFTSVSALAIKRPLLIGGNGFNSAPVVNTLDGRIGEFILCGDALQSSVAGQVRQYLLDKWSTPTVELPSWTPLRFAGLGAWFDETGIVPEDGKLLRWNERTRVWIFEASNPIPAERPSIGAIGSRQAVVFDGANDSIFDSSIQYTMQPGGFDVFTLLQIDGASLNGAAYDNHAVYCDSGYKWGLFVRVAAGQTYLQGYVYDGAGIRVAEVPISQGVPLIVRFWGDGTNIGVEVYGGASATVASGPVSSVEGQLFFGVNASYSGGYLHGKIGEHISCRQKQSAEDVAECFAYLSTKWGL